MRAVLLCLALGAFASSTAARAEPTPSDLGLACVLPSAAADSVTFDAARVMRRTAMGLRIRLLVDTWPVMEPDLVSRAGRAAAIGAQRMEVPASFEERLRFAADAIGNARGETVTLDTTLVRFLFAPTQGSIPGIPKDKCLRETLDLLERHFPRLSGLRSSEPQPGAALARGLGDLTYSVFTPAGSALASEPAAGGAGVSFQQALLEGTTAFVIDRARAELARAGLEKFQRELRSSKLRDAFPRTLALGGFTGAGGDAYRDPRLYLPALQAALADDFDGLPTYVSSSFRETVALGLEPHEWELAHRTLGLVSDVQRGTHPLLALSTFASQEFGPDADPTLRSRMLELHALTSALYAGPGTVDGRAYTARRVLDTLDGRRLFAVFLADELRRMKAVGVCPEVWMCVDDVEARIASLRQTLDEIVREVQELRDTFDQIRAANPDQAGAVYADYIAVVTRAVRQVLVTTQDDRTDARALRVLDQVERVLTIREAVVRRDYPGAVSHAMPYLALIAGEAGGPAVREATSELDAALVLLLPGPSVTKDRERRAVDQARRLMAAVAPAVNQAKAGAEKRETTLGGLGERCGKDPGALCTAVGRLVKLSSEADSTWERASLAFRSGMPKRSTLPEARTRLEDAIERLRDGHSAERAFLFQARHAMTLTVDEASSKLDREHFRESVKEYVSGTDIGQMLVAAASLVSSTSSEGVYDALVVYSAPPGSFRDRRRIRPSLEEGKRGRAFSVSLGAYPGFSAGREWVGQRLRGDAGTHVGLTLPVGVEMTWAVHGFGPIPVPGSIGVFFSPLNLGTFADYRVGGPSTTPSGEAFEDAPAYTFAQVLAPSAYVALGLSEDLPLTFGFGGGYVLGLRERADNDAALGAWRLSAFLAVDVPLWIVQ